MFPVAVNPSYGIVTREDLMADETLLRGFLLLHEKASNLIITSPGEAASVIADEIKVVDVGFVLQVLSLSPRYCASVPQPYIDATMDFVPVLKQMGYLHMDLSQEDVFELRFIKSIHPEGHHYLEQLKI